MGGAGGGGVRGISGRGEIRGLAGQRFAGSNRCLQEIANRFTLRLVQNASPVNIHPRNKACCRHINQGVFHCWNAEVIAVLYQVDPEPGLHCKGPRPPSF